MGLHAHRPYASAIAELLDPDGRLFHQVIANTASSDSTGMPVDQLKSFSRVGQLNISCSEVSHGLKNS